MTLDLAKLRAETLALMEERYLGPRETSLASDKLWLLDEIERLRAVLERIETASRHWADYEAAPDAVHYAHESTARLARAALPEGGPDDR